MRCYSCFKLSFHALCKECIGRLFVPTITKREVGTLEVISFYKYSALEPLLLHKHKPQGHRIYKQLAQLVLTPFIKNFTQLDKQEIFIIGIDERVESGYSHIATLTHQMKMPYIKVQHWALNSQSKVKYAGKSLLFRLNNPRDFIYKGRENIDAIIVDDIITTGLTLQEAQITLSRHNVNVLFALTLADARE